MRTTSASANNSGDTIKSGSSRAAKPTAPAARPRPFIPKRPPPAKSVYSESDYDNEGNLKTTKSVPIGEKYHDRARMVGVDTSNVPKTDQKPPVKLPGTSTTASKKLDASALPTGAQADLSGDSPYDFTPGKTDRLPDGFSKTVLDKKKRDLKTPKYLMAEDPDEQFIAVVRTIENRHPDQDRILQHFALQYTKRMNGTYDPIEDPPVVLSDLLPTMVVVIDRIFGKDEVSGEMRPISEYCKKLHDVTEMDVFPAYVNRPFTLPLPPDMQFQYKDPILNQIMSEFYEGQHDGASEIVERMELDRAGEGETKPAKWQVYDGVSPQGVFGPQSTITTLAETKPTGTGASAKVEQEEDEEEPAYTQSWAAAVDEGDEWTTVGKGKAKAKTFTEVERKGGMRMRERGGAKRAGKRA